MAKAICVNCRHYKRQNTFPAAWCTSPQAERNDRIRGVVHPILEPALCEEEAKSIKAVTDKCDFESWFQERKPWWMF
jgi:hypothetical protein